MKKILKGLVVGSVFLSIGIPKINALSIDGVPAPIGGTNLVVQKDSEGKYTLRVNASVSSDIVIADNEEVRMILENNAELSNKTSDTIYVSKLGKLTIEGKGTITNNTHAKAVLFNSGTTTLKSADVIITRKMIKHKTDSNQNNNYYAILNHGNMTIENAKVIEKKVSGDDNLTNYESSLIATGYYDYGSKDQRTGYDENYNWPNPKLEILGGEFTGGMNTVKNDDGGILNIKGGTFKNTYQVTVMNWNETTIDGGTFDTTGNIKDKTALYNGMYDINVTKGIININGGTFIGDYILEGSNSLADKALKVNIKDGKFQYAIDFVRTLESSNSTKKATAELKNKASVVITGGNYAKNDVGTLYGLTLEKQADNTYALSVPKPDAPTGEIEYSTLEKTNKDVVAKLVKLPAGTNITNNDGKDTYTFTKNDTFTFEFEKDGVKGTATATVNNIDKEAPTAIVVYDVVKSTTGPVVVTLSDYSEDINITNNEGKNTYTFTENGEFTFTFIDKAGNLGSTKATVTWITKGANDNNNNNNNNNNPTYNPDQGFRPPQTSDKIIMYGGMIVFGLGVIGYITKKFI